MTVTFHNQGLIDLRSFSVHGLSAKETENPIGYFGTGLKYAIAVLLREGATVRMFRDGDLYTFSTIEDNMRGKDFSQVTMTCEAIGAGPEQLLPFTLELGKNWKLWQAFRELYCNALDEDGGVENSTAIGSALHTEIEVDLPEFDELYSRKDEIVISKSRPEATPGTKGCKVYHGSSAHGFYRGIQVFDLTRRSPLTWSVHSELVLTEDRTLKENYGFYRAVAHFLRNCEDRAFLSKLFNDLIDEGISSLLPLELSSLQWAYGEPSSTFLDVIGDLRRKRPGAVPKALNKIWAEHRASEAAEEDLIGLTQVQQAMLKRAIKACSSAGFEVDRYPIKVVAALANCDHHATAIDGQMYLSRICFDKGTKYLAGVLLEEFIHLEEKLHDCSRQMQNRLFDIITTLIEEVNGEPM